MEGLLAPSHLLVIAVLFVVLFGAKRLPDSARALGRSARILKAETRGLAEDTTSLSPDIAPAVDARVDPSTGQPLTAPMPPGSAAPAHPMNPAPPQPRQP